MLKKIQVKKALLRLIESTVIDWFAVSVDYNVYTPDGEWYETKTFTVDKLETLQELTEMFGTWYYVYDDELITWSTILSELPQEGLADCFRRYKEHCSVNLSKMLSAYESAYNPLENYNGNETATESYTNYKDEKTISGTVRTNARVKGYSANAGDIQVTNTEGGYTTSVDINDGNNTPDWRAKTTHSETAYNTTDLKDVAQDIASPSVSTTMTQADSDNNFTTWDDYKETNTKTGSRTNSLTRHGNLGVTTSQSMVNAELELRKHDLFEDWLSTFAKKYLILSPDVHEEDSEWGGLF